MKYELIIFDADNTLFDYDKAETESLKNAFLSFDVNFLPEYKATYRKINDEIWIHFEMEEMNIDEVKIKRFERLFHQLKMDIDAHLFSDAYLKYLSESSFLLENALEILNLLHGKTRLALMTNGFANVQHSRFDKSAIKEYFEEIIISEEVGSPKPEPGIFQHAFERLAHSNKETVLMIGDSLRSDIKGGVNFGIDTCWYNPANKANETEITPTYEINDLMELKEILLV
jgi:putative hydrolase of the HAD superfamily